MMKIKLNSNGSIAINPAGGICLCPAGLCLYFNGTITDLGPFSEQLIAEDTVYSGNWGTFAITLEADSAAGYIYIVWSIMVWPQSYRLAYTTDSSGFCDPAGSYDWYAGDNVPRPDPIVITWGACS